MRELGIAGGDGFQYVQALTYAPSNPAFVYLSVDQSGVWRSDDGGRSWEPKFKGFFAYGARSIAVDPLNPLVVVAAGFLGFDAEGAAKYPTRYQGIFLTIDGGESWRMVRATDFYKQAVNGSLFAFGPAPADGNRDRSRVLWCASASEGLLHSENGGETWALSDFRETGIHNLALLPDGSGKLLLASPRGLWGYSPGGIEKLGQGLPTFPRSIAVSTASPHKVHVALGLEGVATSSDGGKNFSPPTKQLGRFFSTMDVTDIAASPVDGKRLYLRANLNSQPPYASADGGVTWQSTQSVDPEEVLDKPGFYFCSPFAPHPTDPNTCLHVTNGRARIIRTTDGGETWRFSGSGFSGARMVDILFLGPTTMIFCLTDHGFWLTEDNGQSFSELPTPRLHGAKSVSAAAASGEHIVAGFGDWEKKGLLVSHNGGKSFNAHPELQDSFSFVAFHPKTPGLVYAGPFISNDYGRIWRRLPETVRAMSPDGSVLYALAATGSASSTLMASVDGGQSFSPKMRLGFASQVINQIVAPSADTLLLATTRGVYRIEKDQIELRDARHGLAKDYFGTMFVNTVAYDPRNPDRVFAGRRALGYGNGNGVFMSSDNGLSWQDMNLNLSPGITIFAIKVSPFDGSVYLGTSFGTFRLGGANANQFTPSFINIRKNENSAGQ
jgi:photosystem II stability/assembly factor-like uncharacterized protein